MGADDKLKSDHNAVMFLINSSEGKTLYGKIVKSNKKIKEACLRKAEDILLKMIDLNEKSLYVEHIRQKLYGSTEKAKEIEVEIAKQEALLRKNKSVKKNTLLDLFWGSLIVLALIIAVPLTMIWLGFFKF